MKLCNGYIVVIFAGFGHFKWWQPGKRQWQLSSKLICRKNPETVLEETKIWGVISQMHEVQRQLDEI